MPIFETAKYGAVDQNVTYHTVDGQEIQMDVYYPASGGPWPGLIFVHGGGWSEGDKAPLPLPVIPATFGYLTVSINYRMFPAYRFPAMIEDVKCAIRYLRAHAETYHLDPDRIALMGHSAGSHLVALAGLVGQSAGWDSGPFAEVSSEVQAVIALSGPADLARPFPEWVIELIHNVFGPEQIAKASPVQYAHPKAPPFFIAHGDADPVVPVEQAELLVQALASEGCLVEKMILHNAGHGFEPAGGTVSPSVEEMFTRILTFLSIHLRG